MKGTPFELDTTKRYSYEDLIDRRLKVWLGPDKGLEWLMSDQGGLLVWGAKPEERFKGAFRKSRLHVYYEFMVGAKEDLDETVENLKLDWWDTSDYLPVPDWKPCPAYTNKGKEFDLFLINYKVPMMAHAVGRFNPLPMQLVSARKHLDSVLIHPDTAARLGIKDGDRIIVENWRGRKQESVASLSERIHPEVVATTQHKLRKGIDFNEFASADEDTIDFVSGAIDACILVKVSKAE